MKNVIIGKRCAFIIWPLSNSCETALSFPFCSRIIMIYWSRKLQFSNLSKHSGFDYYLKDFSMKLNAIL